ncbi:MAG: hypothetical protein JWM68_4219 [Verrucomicrobiales bacterium]|nr:hypothetical protein [Verrucomicrobiales bacterium]
MRTQILFAVFVVVALTGCGRKDEHPNGRYGQAGLTTGAKDTGTNTETNYPPNENNPLHRVAK